MSRNGFKFPNDRRGGSIQGKRIPVRAAPGGGGCCSDGETGGSAAPLLIQTVRNFSRLCEFVVRGVLGPTGAALSDAPVFRDQAAHRPTVN